MATLGGCATDENGLLTSSLGNTTFPESKSSFKEAQLQFKEGHYGLAIDAYAKTVEGDPKNPEAWLGLAASYDHTGRFDQADRAYQKVQDLVGPTPSVLNNLGYSHLMRGNLDRSAEMLSAAHRGDPGNPYILNNIDILNARLIELGKPPVATN
jgi:Flp pilus assembly protein TadD